MPFPRQVTAESIVDKGRELLEQLGTDGTSLTAIADALHIRPPSLYRYYRNRSALLKAMNTLTVREQIRAMDEAASRGHNAQTSLLYAARAFRDYAHEWPASVLMAYGSSDHQVQAAAAEAERLVLPMQALVAELCGEEQSLTGLRGLFALVFGFVALEMNGVFRRGGDLSAAYETAVMVYLDGLRQQ